MTVLVHGKFVVGNPCSAVGGYSDVSAGAQVVIKDGAGAILQTGALGLGHLVDYSGLNATCAFDFSVDGVPDAPFYQVEVSSRGDISYSAVEMEQNGWHVELSL
jgi:hypothetical protein